MILNRHDTGASACKQTRGFAADANKTLNRNASAFNGDSSPDARLPAADENAAPTFSRPSEPPRWIGATGDDARPSCHDSWNTYPSSKAITLPLVPTSGAGISSSAARMIMPIRWYSGGSNAPVHLPTARTDRRGCRLWRRCTADSQRGTFDGHPCRQGHHFIEINVRMVRTPLIRPRRGFSCCTRHPK